MSDKLTYDYLLAATARYKMALQAIVASQSSKIDGANALAIAEEALSVGETDSK